MSKARATVELVAGTSLAWTWEVLTPIDPTRFYPRFGIIPATVAVRDQSGPWNVVGSTRTLLLSDGGRVVETIIDVVEPTFFAYELTEFSKVFKVLVDHARAEWTFTEVEGGTHVSWSYEFFARKGWGWVLGVIIARAWEPYMRSVLPEIVHEAERLA